MNEDNPQATKAQVNGENPQAFSNDGRVSSQAKLTSTGALRDFYPGWGPDVYKDPSYPSVNEVGVVEASNPPAGIDQPVDDIAHIINHFRFKRTVTEAVLRQHHMYLVTKYDGYLSYLHTHESLVEGVDDPSDTHKVYATAVANDDDYHKVIDEDTADFTTSRHEELNGLLKSTLEAVSLEETSDANICSTKWVDKVKPDGSLKSR